jgi:S-adenosylmethionine hydrolase
MSDGAGVTGNVSGFVRAGTVTVGGIDVGVGVEVAGINVSVGNGVAVGADNALHDATKNRQSSHQMTLLFFIHTTQNGAFF